MGERTKHRGIVKLGANMFEVRVRATCPRTGQERSARREFPGTLREARVEQERMRDELISKLNARTEAAPPDTLATFVTSWLASRIERDRAKNRRTRPATAAKIASVWENHLRPTFGAFYVDAVDRRDVEEWLAEQGRSGASPATVLGRYRVLRGIARAAAKRYDLPRDFCQGVEAPASTDEDVEARHRDNVLTADELAKVLGAIEPEWRAAVLLLATTALRWGELSALKWEDVDEGEGVIRVRRVNWKGREVPGTKTGAARTVPLLPVVAAELRAHRARCKVPGQEWIFATEKPSRYRKGARAGEVRPAGSLFMGTPLLGEEKGALTRALRAVGITRRVTVHGMRHTANDLLRRVASAEVTRAITGHVTERMTEHYSHVDAGEKRVAASRVLAMLGPKTGGETGGDRNGGEERQTGWLKALGFTAG
jgi:integrase